ncbi:MAG: hypothetical protein KF754_06235 [Planctomycetes bacterium]|nr:hypothetical protein [Planctomycetota bacterium]
MPTTRTHPETWPIDTRNLLPETHQRAAWNALVEARDLLSEIALTCKLLGATAFDGQEESQCLSATLHTALIELDVALGAKGVLTFETRQ